MSVRLGDVLPEQTVRLSCGCVVRRLVDDHHSVLKVETQESCGTHHSRSRWVGANEQVEPMLNWLTMKLPQGS